MSKYHREQYEEERTYLQDANYDYLMIELTDRQIAIKKENPGTSPKEIYVSKSLLVNFIYVLTYHLIL